VGAILAAWLGLVPRQVTTGGKPRLVGITKRGNKYLRKLIIHGATRFALPALASGPSPLGERLRALMKRVHKRSGRRLGISYAFIMCHLASSVV
jgi:transposase